MIPATSQEIDDALSHVAGDSFPGISEFQLLIGNDPPTPDVSTCSLTIWRVKTGEQVAQLTNGAGVTVVSASTWTLEVPQTNDVALDADIYTYGFRVVDTDTFSATWLVGFFEVFTLIPAEA